METDVVYLDVNKESTDRLLLESIRAKIELLE